MSNPQAPAQGRTLTRAFPATVHTRAASADAPTGREFTGLAVPFGSEIDVFGFREQFAPGSIVPDPTVLVCWRHDEPVGIVTGHRDTDTGWEVDARLSDTTQGRDAAALVADGVVSKLSISFTPEEWTETRDDAGVSHVTYTRARVNEVSLVPFPAYADAALSQVRQAPDGITPPPPPTHDTPTPPSTTDKETPTVTTTTDTTAAEAELRASVDELTRRVELIGTTGETRAAVNPLAQFRSMGEYVKAVAQGDERALRAYEGLVTHDLDLTTAPNWAANVVKLIDARTPTAGWFNHTKDLPATGMTVEYGTVYLNNGLRVAEQLAEGDDLVFGKLGLGTRNSAQVYTVGGWTDMSRQVIERSPINVVDLMWRAFAVKYAEAVEAITAQAMTAAYNARRAAAGGTLPADLTTADGIIDALVDLATRYAAGAYSLDALYVAPDVFKTMAKINEQPKALQITAAPANKVGTLSVSVPEASLSGIPVKLWADAPAGAAFAADAQAIKVQESPGAPFRLQDENIVNLTKQFSVYGYVTAYAEMPEGIVPLVPAAV